MKISTLLLSALAAIASGNSVSAQGLYLRAGIGQAFPMAGQTLSGLGWPYNGSISNDINYNINGASFSAGTYLNASIGYMANKHIGAELHANVGIAPKQYSYRDNYILVGGVPSYLEVAHFAQLPVFLSPSLVLQSSEGKVSAYSRMGPTLPINTSLTREITLENHPGTGLKTVRVETWDIRTKFSVGISAAVGVQYKLNSQVSLWGEVSMLSGAKYVSEENMERFVYNGVDIDISTLPSNFILKRVYGKNITIDTPVYSIRPTYSIPFSNVSVAAGIKYNLKKQTRRLPGEMERKESL
jgi:hypothetical protein